MTEDEKASQHEGMLKEFAMSLEPLFAVCGGRLAVRGKSLLGYDILNGVYDADHVGELVRDLLVTSTDRAYMWWATLNPFDDAILTTNMLSWGFGIPKQQITRACWLIIDFDPIRPEAEANAGEREASRLLMETVQAFLLARGFPAPWIVMSGNGYQLRYRVDLPADHPSEQLLKHLMVLLHKLYTNPAVKVDTSLWDLPRVLKIPGRIPAKDCRLRIAHSALRRLSANRRRLRSYQQQHCER